MTLPHQAQTASAHSTTKDQVRKLDHRKILVVDDSPDNLLLIGHLLTLAGAEVDTAGNGREGVDKAIRGDYSAILMDLQMPEMDGYQAVKELREKGFRRPVIALTAHAMKEERERCLKNGFDNHLTKPVDRAALINTLATYH
jgi:CheY-like chemotaxis protein